MKLKKKIIKWMNSKNNQIYTENYLNLFKIPLKNNNGYAIYKTSSIFDNYASRIQYIVSCLNNGEIVHINPLLSQYNTVYQDISIHTLKFLSGENIEPEDVKKLNSMYDDKLKELSNKLKEILSNRNEKLDTFYSYEKFREYGMQYFRNQNKIAHPIDQLNLSMNPDLISDYYDDDFFQCSNDLLTNNVKKAYDEYYLSCKAMNDYIKEIDADPEKKINKSIIDTLLNDKYKTFRIFHTLPSGKQKEFRFKKGTVKYGNVSKAVVEDNIIYNIPLQAIDKIVYGKNVLFERENDKKRNLEELAILYAKCKRDTMVNEIIDGFKNNEKVMKELFKTKANTFGKYGDNLKSSPEFILDILKNNANCLNSYYVFNDIDKSLYKNKSFVYTVLDMMKENNKLDKATFISKIDTSIISPKMLGQILNLKYISETFCKSVPKSIINTKENLEIISNLFNKVFERSSNVAYCLLPLITDKESLLKITDTENLSKYICMLDQDILDDRDFIIELLNCKSANPFNGQITNIKKLYDMYSDDDIMLTKIAITSQNLYQAKNVISMLNIDESDREKFFELASQNIFFYSLLTDNEKEIFLTAESLEISELIENKDKDNNVKSYSFKTLSGNIELCKTDKCAFYFKDFRGNQLYLSDKEVELIKENLQNYLINDMKLEYDPKKDLYDNIKNSFNKTLDDIINSYSDNTSIETKTAEINIEK